jgi:hypothetical protein
MADEAEAATTESPAPEVAEGAARPRPPALIREPALDPADIAAVQSLDSAAEAEPGLLVDFFGLRTPVALAPELAGFVGTRLPRPAPKGDRRAVGAEWAGLAHSIVAAEGSWRALQIAAGRGDLLLSGGVAARRRGLETRLHATEDDPGRFNALCRHAEANGFDPSAQGFRQAAVGIDPAAPPARGTTVPELLDAEPLWNWVRIGTPGAMAALLPSLDTLAPRLRVLSIATHSRAEEAAMAGALDAAGWRLVGEVASGMARRDPRSALRAGVQVWRSPAA